MEERVRHSIEIQIGKLSSQEQHVKTISTVNSRHEQLTRADESHSHFSELSQQTTSTPQTEQSQQASQVSTSALSVQCLTPSEIQNLASSIEPTVLSNTSTALASRSLSPRPRLKSYDAYSQADAKVKVWHNNVPDIETEERRRYETVIKNLGDYVQTKIGGRLQKIFYRQFECSIRGKDPACAIVMRIHHTQLKEIKELLSRRWILKIYRLYPLGRRRGRMWLKIDHYDAEVYKPIPLVFQAYRDNEDDIPSIPSIPVARTEVRGAVAVAPGIDDLRAALDASRGSAIGMRISDPTGKYFGTLAALVQYDGRLMGLLAAHLLARQGSWKVPTKAIYRDKSARYVLQDEEFSFSAKIQVGGNVGQVQTRVAVPRFMLLDKPMHDIALCTMDDERLLKANAYRPTSTAAAFLSIDNVAEELPLKATRVVVVSTNCPTKQGLLLPTATFTIGSSEAMLETWSVRMDDDYVIALGDSGSLVVDVNTGKAFGFVIARDMYGHAEVLPLAHVFKRINEATGKDISLATAETIQARRDELLCPSQDFSEGICCSQRGVSRIESPTTSDNSPSGAAQTCPALSFTTDTPDRGMILPSAFDVASNDSIRSIISSDLDEYGEYCTDADSMTLVGESSSEDTDDGVLELLVTANNVPKFGPVKAFCTLADLSILDSKDFFSLHMGQKDLGWLVIDDRLRLERPLTIDQNTLDLQRNKMVQIWAFFGLLREIFSNDPSFCLDLFFDRSSNNRIKITLAPLGDLIARWYERERVNQRLRFQRLSRARRALQHIRHFVFNYCSASHDPAGRSEVSWPIDDSLAFSLIYLGQTLTDALHQIEQKLGINIGGCYLSRKWGSSRAVLEALERSGWTSTSMRLLLQFWQDDTAGLLLALCYGNPRQFFRDDPCPNKLYHFERCSGSCSQVGADIAREVVEILQDDHVPLFRYDNETRNLSVTSISNTMDQDYVVFSHYWADGFGNSAGNTINSCVVEQFGEIIVQIRAHEMRLHQRALPARPQLFWIDTLGVPIADGQEHLRNKAIAQMHSLLKHAKYTVALDAGLLQMEINEAIEDDLTKCAANITLCGWMRRLWTLQEAVLSKNIYFKFSNGLLALNMLENHYRSQNQHIHDSIQISARHYVDMMPTIAQSLGRYSSDSRFVFRMCKVLRYRATSKEQHEALVLAIIRGLNPTELAGSYNPKQASTEQELAERMQTLIKMLGDDKPSPLHAGMVFLRGPWLPDKGFRWAPSSWLTSRQIDHPDPLDQDYEPVRLIAGIGLQVRLFGFLLHDFWKCLPLANESSLASFLVHDGVSRRYSLRRADEFPWPLQQDIEGRQIALVCAANNIFFHKQIALLVMIVKEGRGIFTANILLRVWISREPSLDDLGTESCFGEPLEEKQCWCLDR